MSPDQMNIDFSTPEMRAAWREARWLLINIAAAGCCLADVAGDRLTGSPDGFSTANWIGTVCGFYCAVACTLQARSLLRIVASTYRHLAISNIFLIGCLAFLCGLFIGGAVGCRHAPVFQLLLRFKNLVPVGTSAMLFAAVALWLISAALVPLLLNRRSLR
jgi:hypothetical protein